MTREPSPPWVVVIAGSSGSLPALKALLSRLPAHLPAAVLVASHTSSTSHRELPHLLSKACSLPAAYAEEGQRLEAGRIFVAPPGVHLVVKGRRMRLTSGEKEHGLRSAADVLFRSAALAYGPRCLGIVLSGGGRDEAEGLAVIQAAGGRTLIQAPSDALLETMPLNALTGVTPEACVSVEELGPLVEHFTRARGQAGRGTSPVPAPRAHRRERALPLNGLSVFVAEDEYLIASEIVDMLRVLGCGTVGPVADVNMGLRLLVETREPLDCALLDLDLRGESVLPLALEFGRRAIPLVLATGYGKDSLPEEWRGAPRLQKPYDTDALGEALRHALRVQWRAPTGPSASASDVRYQAELLKDARNLLMKSYVRMTSSSEDIIKRAHEAMRRTDECIVRSTLRQGSSRRRLPERLPSVTADEDEGEDGT
ncbi:MAG: chemotaxis protein CheB [Cystobacter sp.]